MTSSASIIEWPAVEGCSPDLSDARSTVLHSSTSGIESGCRRRQITKAGDDCKGYLVPGSEATMYRADDVREAIRIAMQRGNDLAAWNSGLTEDGIAAEADELFDDMVPVEPCKHGDLDRHWVTGPCFCGQRHPVTKEKGQYGPTGLQDEYSEVVWTPCTHEWCPGAGIGGDDE